MSSKITAKFPGFWQNHWGFYIAHDPDYALQAADELSLRTVRRYEFGDRLTPLGNYEGFSGSPHLFHEREAVRLELRPSNCLHGHITAYMVTSM